VQTESDLNPARLLKPVRLWRGRSAWRGAARRSERRALGDKIPLTAEQTLRVLGVRDDDADQPPALVGESVGSDTAGNAAVAGVEVARERSLLFQAEPDVVADPPRHWITHLLRG
jgi:hypothetical protein